MAKKQYMKGGALMVHINCTSYTGTINLSSSCSINETASIIDPETKDDSKYQQVDPDGNKWTIQCDFQVDNNMTNYKALFNLKKSHNSCSLTVAKPTNYTDEGLPQAGWQMNTNSLSKWLTGDAYITSLSMNAPKNGKTTASVTFTGKTKLNFQEAATVPEIEEPLQPVEG